ARPSQGLPAGGARRTGRAPLPPSMPPITFSPARSTSLLFVDEDLVDEPVLLGLGSREVEIAIDVAGDVVVRSPGRLHEDPREDLLDVPNLPSLDLDVGSLTAGSAHRLMDHDPRVG